MHPDAMKHKASLWDGELGNSRHITDVYWEGDISQAELMEVADQISSDWKTIDLELDAAHPCHGRTYQLLKPWLGAMVDDYSEHIRTTVDALQGQYVWVHCCQHVYDPAGELEDEEGHAYRQVFNTIMFCTEFSSFDDIATQCDAHFGQDEWDEYELYLDDELPVPAAIYS